jgi:hypothetical protein
MEEFIELLADGADDGLLAMADVEAANAPGKINVAVAIDIFEPGVSGFGDVDGRGVRQAAGHGLRAALTECAGVGAGDGSAEFDS